MPIGQDESFELGLPFSTQDIPELEGVPDLTDRSGWRIDYRKEGYCVRSIASLNPTEFGELDIFATNIRGHRHQEEADWVGLEDLESIMRKQEKALNECYDEIKVLIDTHGQIRWLLFSYMYWMYTCRKFSALLDTMLNALSVKRVIAEPLRRLDSQRKERNAIRAEGNFGRFVLRRAVAESVESNILPVPDPQEKWIWLYSRCLHNQTPNILAENSQLSLTPQRISITRDVQDRWLKEMAWRTDLGDGKLVSLWDNGMKASMGEPIVSLLAPRQTALVCTREENKQSVTESIDDLTTPCSTVEELCTRYVDSLLPPRSITLEDLCTRNEDGITRTTRLDCHDLKIRKFPLRTRSCGAKIPGWGPNYIKPIRWGQDQSVNLYHLLIQKPRRELPESLSYLRPPEIYDWRHARRLEYWEDCRRPTADEEQWPLYWGRKMRKMFRTGYPLVIVETVVVGWFPGNKRIPKEMCIRISREGCLRFFHQLHLHVMVLRGWRSFFSFKTVQGFGLYKVRGYDHLNNSI